MPMMANIANLTHLCSVDQNCVYNWHTKLLEMAGMIKMDDMEDMRKIADMTISDPLLQQ